MKDSKKVTINGEKVEIKKIPIRKFSELMFAVNKALPKVMDFFSDDELDNLTNDIFLTKIPILVANVQDEFFDIVSIISGIEKEVVEELDLETFTDLVITIHELNNIPSIVKKVKNSMGMPLKK